MEAVEEVAVVPEVAEEILKVAEEEAAAVEDMAITLEEVMVVILEAMEVVVALGVAKIKEIKEEILGTKIKEADMEVEEDKEVMVEEEIIPGEEAIKEAMAKTKEVMAAEAGVVILVETKEDKVDGMVAMDKTKEVVVVMEEEIVIMAHHLEEEAAEVPCEEVQDMEANEEAGVEVMETTVLPLILLVEVAVVAEEECKKFQKNFPPKVARD